MSQISATAPPETAGHIESQAASTGQTPPPAPIDHSKSVAQFDYMALLRRVAKTAGKSPWAQSLDMWRLFMGPGGITPFDYYYYGLYDDARSTAAKRAFVGSRLRTKITNEILDNYFYGVGLDKITFYACMAGLGLPIPKTLALFHPTRMLGQAEHLRSREAFEDFLRLPAHYPCFCKPAEETGSLGVASLAKYHSSDDEIELASGSRFPVARFVDEAARYFDSGYLIQERVRSHPEIEKITGSGLSTIRLMILRDGDSPQIIRATWRIPVGGSVADVLWRGNMMAALDPETGTVQRVIKGFGPDLAEVEVHRDSGERLSGYTLPLWSSVRDLALLGAAALPKLELTGWDLSITDRGPMLIELEPDGGEPTVTQLASGLGLLDGPYGEFVRRRQSEKKRR